ncbi:uncharacterized protein EDB91DRAFT_1160320, partial [Suillus paluster]|uniref:uncharacterized protein n=1 Tax=Suillus paluster TaxID=48578 RepID=UPI001B86003F
MAHTTSRTMCLGLMLRRVAYGKNTSTSATDLEVIEDSQLNRRIGAILRPGACLVDSIPWLKYLRYGWDL